MGQTLRDLMVAMPEAVLGRCPSANGRFPLLLKFLDTLQPLSVQVHPNDEQAARLAPPKAGDISIGKTEAWVILETDEDSRLYAGLNPGVDREIFESALRKGVLDQTLHTFAVNRGDCVNLPAGTVHAIGAGLMLFEVQQTSDLTYRLFDWNRVDHRTGRPRALHVEESLMCTDFAQGPTNPITSTMLADVPNFGESLIHGPYFGMDRWTVRKSMPVGMAGECRVIVPIAGSGVLISDHGNEAITAGEIIMLPASMGPAHLEPMGTMTVLEIIVPV